MSGYADAVTREVAWLNEDTELAGALGQVAAYARTTQAGLKAAWLLRERVVEDRFDIARRRLTHHFVLRLEWPVNTAAAKPEAVAQKVDDALQQLLARVRGPFGDKTHGARFLAVAEDPTGGDGPIEVRYLPSAAAANPETTEQIVVEVRWRAEELTAVA